MAKNFFIWTKTPAIDRKGNRLEPGQKYRAADFDRAIIKAWIASGAAIYAPEPPGNPDPANNLKPGPGTARAKKKNIYKEN